MIFLFGPAGFGMIANSMFAVTTTEALTTVPLYVLMGEILLRSGSIDALFNRSTSWSAACAAGSTTWR